MAENPPRTAIIGAGISGLTSGKILKDYGVGYTTFELSDRIGGNWAFGNPNGLSSAYRSLHIDTSKERLSFKDGSKVVMLNADDIDWIDAAGDYMCIHAQGKTHIIRETMKTLQQRLDPERFQRIHRSAIVNVGKVKELHPHSNGEYFVILENGSELKLSRSYKEVVARFL